MGYITSGKKITTYTPENLLARQDGGSVGPNVTRGKRRAVRTRSEKTEPKSGSQGARLPSRGIHWGKEKLQRAFSNADPERENPIPLQTIFRPPD